MLVSNKTIAHICLVIFLFLITSCAPEVVVPKSDHSPEAALWVGDWTIWVAKSHDSEPTEVFFTADGNLIAGSVAISEGASADFTAEVGAGGHAALGTHESNEGLSDSVSLILSADGNQFSGYLHGIAAMCGAREGFEKPDPCLSAFGHGWDGGWTVWIGSIEMEGKLFFDPAGESIGPLNYDVELALSDDGSILAGKWMAVGSTGKLEAVLLENGVQFVGNMDGIFPFCGVRPGGPKPETCMAP